MTRYTLHVPEQRNDGTPVGVEYREHVERELLDIAGGFTLTHGVGAWRGDDTIYREPVALYAVDFPSDDLGLAGDLLRDLARDIARALIQEAVYLTRAEITAQLVTPERVPA